MDTSETTRTTGEGVRVRAARPRIHCPHCRAVDPEINYGELAYYEQPYDPRTEDWTAAGEVVGETDGSTTIIAKCSACDEDITTYLIGWSRRNPEHAPYAHFVHEVHVPRSLPRPRRARLLSSDRELENGIEEYRKHLGVLLDEREERQRRGVWKPEPERP